MVQIFRHANTHRNSAKRVTSLAKSLKTACRHGRIFFGVPAGVRLTPGDIGYLRDQLSHSLHECVRDKLALELDEHVSRGLAQPLDVTEDKLQHHWESYIRWMHRMQRDIHAELRLQQVEREQQAQQRQQQTQQRPRKGRRRRHGGFFSLLPNRSLGRAFTLLDAEGLATLVLHAGGGHTGKRDSSGRPKRLSRAELAASLRRESGAEWASYVDVHPLCSERRPFAGSVRTDGAACSVLLRRAAADRSCKRVSAKAFRQEVVPPPAGARVVALDPGPVNPLCGVVQRIEGTDDTLRVSGKQWRHEAGFNKYRRRREGRVKRAGLRELMSALPSVKVATEAELLLHLSTILQHGQVLRGFFGRHIEAADRFGQYIAKQRAVGKLCRTVKGGKGAKRHTIVAIGEGRGAHVPGRPPGAVKLVRDALIRYVRGLVEDCAAALQPFVAPPPACP